MLEFESAIQLLNDLKSGELFSASPTSMGALWASIDAVPVEVSGDTVELAQSQTSVTEAPPKELKTLGGDPVARSDADSSAVEAAYEGGDNSPLMQSAQKAAELDGMSENEKEAFFAALQNKDALVQTEVKNGDVLIMGNGTEKGDYSAEKVVLDLPKDQRDVLMGTYTYVGEDGKTYTETFYIFNDCANPAIDAAPDEVVVEQVVPVEPAVAPDSCPQFATSIQEVRDEGYEPGMADRSSFEPARIVHLPDNSEASIEDAREFVAQHPELLFDEKGRQLRVYFSVDTNCDGLPEKIYCYDPKTGEIADLKEMKSTGDTNYNKVGESKRASIYDKGFKDPEEVAPITVIRAGH